MNKPTVKSEANFQAKKMVLPIVGACFLFAIIITITLSGDLVPLMGNSIVNNYICNDGYESVGSRCKLTINAQKLGDLNKDGIVDNSDVFILQNHLNNINILVGTDFLIADVTGDGKINDSDLNKMKFYLGGITDLNGYVCPNNYDLNGKVCTKTNPAIKVNNSYKNNTAVYYNNSYWYVISDNDAYVTLLKRDTIEDSIVKITDIDSVLNNYISDISGDLKEVDGSKIRLITIEELKELGFKDKTNTNYYESDNNTPYWIGLVEKNYWVNNSSINSSTFMVVNYEDNNYVMQSSNNDLAYIRPVINVYKSALK